MVNFPAFRNITSIEDFFCAPVFATFRLMTLSIPDVERACSFLTEVRVEDCLFFSTVVLMQTRRKTLLGDRVANK